MTRLTGIKIIHTIIWIFFNVIIFYLAYAVIKGKIDESVWFCIGIILLEGIILLFFKGICPLTILARRYSDSPRANFDIFLPLWLAKYNKMIYTAIFLIIIIKLLYSYKDSF